jgi:hypothetical protein
MKLPHSFDHGVRYLTSIEALKKEAQVTSGVKSAEVLTIMAAVQVSYYA